MFNGVLSKDIIQTQIEIQIDLFIEPFSCQSNTKCLT